jgi:four helix bundle protein
MMMREKSLAFAVRIVKLYKYLHISKREYIIAKQILRSGTAPGALIREAQNAESKRDFIHKLSFAQKECDEILYWLQVLLQSGILSNYEFEGINNQATELLKMIKSAMLTAKQSLKKT